MSKNLVPIENCHIFILGKSAPFGLKPHWAEFPDVKLRIGMCGTKLFNTFLFNK